MHTRRYSSISTEKSDPSVLPSVIQRRRCFCCLKKRYCVAVLASLAHVIIHAMRTNFSVTAVTILHPHSISGPHSNSTHLVPFLPWTSSQVGALHAVFYAGYLITQIPAGYTMTIWPAHMLFGLCVLISCVTNLLIPIAMRAGFAVVCAIRVFQGLTEGWLYPASHALLRHWSPPSEHSRMGGIIFTGSYAGPIIGFSLGGFLTEYIGWPYVFYVSGTAGIVWYCFWLMFIAEKPDKDRFIRNEEVSYIESCLKETTVPYENLLIPWLKIFTSMPVWAIIISHFCRSWVFYLMVTNEPNYFHVFGYSLSKNGLLSALPHIVMVLVSLLSGFVADGLRSYFQLNTTVVRKLFTCVGFGMEAVCLLALYWTDVGYLAVLFLTLGAGFSGLTISGWQVNHLDLSTRYAAVLVGVSTAFGSIAGIICPIIVGILTAKSTIDEWQLVFLITVAVLGFTVVFYAIFGSGETQGWSNPASPEKRAIINGKEVVRYSSTDSVQSVPSSPCDASEDVYTKMP